VIFSKQTEYVLSCRVVGKGESGDIGRLDISGGVIVVDAGVVHSTVDSADSLRFGPLLWSGRRPDIEQWRVALRTVVVDKVKSIRDVVIK